MNDSEIREFFHANRPAPLKREEFMAQLEQRILLANEIKREHDKQIAFYRRVSLITLIAGLLIGAGITVLTLLRPVSLLQFNTAILVTISTFICKWCHIRRSRSRTPSVSDKMESLLPIRLYDVFVEFGY